MDDDIDALLEAFTSGFHGDPRYDETIPVDGLVPWAADHHAVTHGSSDDDDAVVPGAGFGFADECRHAPPPPPPPAAEAAAPAKMVAGNETSVPVPFWESMEQQLDCGRCSLLREIIHDSDYITTKLQIHGEFGLFHHAVLVATYKMQGVTQYYFSDLHGHENGTVKWFLEEYGEARYREGLILISDSISSFSDALYAGLGGEMAGTSESAATPPPPPPPLDAATNTSTAASSSEAAGSSTDGSREKEGPTVKAPKSVIAAQRERTGKLKLEDIAHCFHLPITTASRELRLCTTALKKICRKHGISRWPHRKVKSTEAMISRLQLSLRNQSGEMARKTLMEMYKLQDDRDRACEGWVGQIRRAQREIAVLQDKMRGCPRSVEAQRIMAEIAELNEKVKTCRHKMEKIGNGKKARSQ